MVTQRRLKKPPVILKKSILINIEPIELKVENKSISFLNKTRCIRTKF